MELDVREEVAWFAERMEEVLRDNDWKGDWKDCSPYWLVERLKEELKELELALTPRTTCNCREAFCGHWPEIRWDKVVKEAVDVANYAMFIADLVKNNQKVGG